MVIAAAVIVLWILAHLLGMGHLPEREAAVASYAKNLKSSIKRGERVVRSGEALTITGHNPLQVIFIGLIASLAGNAWKEIEVREVAGSWNRHTVRP